MIARNSNSRANSRSELRSAFVAITSPRSTPVSTSNFIVASSLEMRASSACSTRFCLRFAPET